MRDSNSRGVAPTRFPSHYTPEGWSLRRERARLQARHPVRGRAAGWGHDGFRPSLRVATCDYAGRSYGCEPLSGQSAGLGSASVRNVRDLGRMSCEMCAERCSPQVNETTNETPLPKDSAGQPVGLGGAAVPRLCLLGTSGGFTSCFAGGTIRLSGIPEVLLVTRR